MARAISDRYPAIAGSAALHAIILISGLIAWPWLNKPLHMGDVVPVTLITSDQAPAPKPAVQAPEPAPAATEEPVPQASPQIAAPEEAPTPSPPIPKAAPQPSPTPHKTAVKPTPAKPAPEPEMDMAALAASLSKEAKATGPRQSSAARGPSRPEQAVEARTSSGTSDAVSAASLASLSGELQRIWNPICNTANASDVVIKVSFKIGSSGLLIGSPQSSLDGAGDNALRVASERAVRSVYQHGPFADPAYRVLYGQNITVNFNQKKDCSNR